MSYLTLIIKHWQWAALAGLLVAGWGYMHERDGRIRAEAVAEIRTETADSALSVAREQERAREDALQRLDGAEDAMATLRASNDSLRSRMATLAQEASGRYIEAGESVRATLDSIMVAETLEDAQRLATEAKRLDAEQDRAHRDQVQALEAQVRVTEASLAAADSITSILRRRVTVVEEERDAWREAALEAERALEARTEASGLGMRHHWAVELGGAAMVGWAGYEAGQAGLF